MSDEELNEYQRALKRYEEEEAARRAAILPEDDPYRKYILLFGNKEAMGGYDDDDDDEEDSEAPTEPALDLPAVRVSERESSGTVSKLKPLITKDLYENPPYHMIIGAAVVYAIQVRGEDLMFTKKGAYRYSNGLWTTETEGLSAWLNVEIEIGAKHYRQPSSIKLINEARAWIQRQEQLFRNHDDIKWDAHGLVPTKSGLVDPRTGAIRPMLPADYCTWRVEAEYDPTAKCPWWLQMLEDVFADREPKERAATTSMIQELLGLGLIDDKPRELSRALVFQGGSNFGKSGLLDVLSGLFGQAVNSASIESLDEAHGKMPFLKRVPWVLHEAFDQRKWHFSSSVKAIVTGDPISINIKNGALITQRFTAPIFWGTNHPPQFKEASKAIANRLVVIECRREFKDDAPVGAAAEAFRRKLGKPSNLVLKEEMPGLLAWAMEGLKRGLARGRLVLTNQMAESIEEIRRDSNMVSGFLEECCYLDCGRMISCPDFCLAFSSWWQQNRGETYSPPSNQAIGKALEAIASSEIALGRELRDKHRRYYAGIILNEEGLAYHHAGADSTHLVAKMANTTDPKGEVNRRIPDSWKEKPEIVAIQKAAGIRF
jgi:P4 family phage/plasmid primase-like protien